ncbi:Gfo/Idh/MocA family protein [Lapillicoccus jejuensis]|uniref:Putative dehydrogenase n=1 Tax=Lapillicoccus jejuensis TaxID=402171 RepID=A0A542DX07_9MICO|nr:Gfo/Idh/MocA family oxidoreductase [Lapillicoccus jejuensis]TQJ07621.1 putative dehydrogenase [Lapillicoccus jejuensis]
MSDGDLRVGLVGAGPWATMFHAPMVAGAAGAELTTVWARRPEAAQALADRFGATATTSYDELLSRVDAVAFAVPPAVQAEMATRAAEAGKHLILDKPLAFTLEDAVRLEAAVDEAGVTSILMLRNRFEPEVVRLLDAAQEVRPRGVLARMLTGAALEGSDFATPWRIERGALYDIGPHTLDLVEAVLGPVVEVSGVGDPTDWVGVTTRHESGAVGHVSLSLTVPGDTGGFRFEVVHEGGTLVLPELGGDGHDGEDAVATAIMAAFLEGVRTGRSHPFDVHRGVVVQRMLHDAGATG